MVNIELYRVFYTVAKCGSLTRAAEELFISQPAVSQAIKQLESQFGVSLFNRTHRGMELSVHGKMVFKQVEEALALLDETENRFLPVKFEPAVPVPGAPEQFRYIGALQSPEQRIADRVGVQEER